jgi:hypothetical protein
MSLRLQASIVCACVASLAASPAFAPPRPELQVAINGPEGAPPCGPECDAPLRDRDADGLAAIGLRVSMTDARQQSVGLSFAGRFATYVDSGPGTARVAMFWNLGGGGAGFEGAFGGSLAGGVRARFDAVQSAVFRLGLEGYVLGDDLFYASAFELPQGQVGYQFFDGRRLFEIGAKSGAVLTGRFRDPSDDGRRAFPVSVEWGGYTSLSLRPLRIDGSYTRIQDRDALGTPIDLLEGNSCGFVGPVALCVDARWQRGDLVAAAGGPKQLTSLYGGLTAGFGYRGDPDERKRRRGPDEPPPPPPPTPPPPLQVPASDGPNAPAML